MRAVIYSVCFLLAILFLFVPPKKNGPLEQEKTFSTISYPPGKSFPQVDHEFFIPHFEKVIATPVVYGDLTFALWNLFPKERQRFLLDGTKNSAHKNIHFDPSFFRKKYSGARVNFADKDITMKARRTGIPYTKRSNALAAVLANFDQGIGLILTFPSLAYKVYFTPVNSANLRAFTVTPSGTYLDKGYEDLDHAQADVLDPDYYLALLDAGFRGDFSLAKNLPDTQQELLVDTISISLAECFQRWEIHTVEVKSELWVKYPQTTKIKEMISIPFSYARSAGPFFNALLMEFYNRGVFMMTREKDMPLTLEQTKNMKKFSGAYYVSPLRLLNEKIITRGLVIAHPYELSAISLHLHNQHADNYFDMLAYMAEHPEYYDMEMRMNLWKIIKNIQYDAPVINFQLQQYIESHGQNDRKTAPSAP